MSATRQHSANRRGLMLKVGFVVVFVACVCLLALNAQLLGGPTETRVSMDVDISDGWTDEDGDPISLSDLRSIPGFAERGVTVSRRLPKAIESGIELNFLSKNCTFSLSYGDVEVYSYEPDVTEHGVAFGCHFNFAPLSPQDGGETATLRIMPAYPTSAAQILDVRLSGTTVYIQRFVREHALALIMSLVVCFIGVTVIVLHFSLFGRRKSDLDLLSLGSISVLLGIWAAAETLVPQLILGTTPIIRALDHLALLFVPYPMILFVGSLVHPPRRRSFELVSLTVETVCVSATMVLALVAHIDMYLLHPIAQIQLLLLCAMIFCEVISSFRQRRGGLREAMRQANQPILIAFMVFVVSALTDFITFNVTAYGLTDAAFFMRFSLFAFSIVLAYEALQASIEFLRRAENAEHIEAIAYTDALTGIGNRTAWQIMSTEVDELLAAGKVDDAAVCQFDVNFLKRINDTYGHAAGDDHLRRAADTINRSFGTEGTCYRTGGDEFCALIVGISLPERLERCQDLLTCSIVEQNEMDEGAVELSVAVGHACVSETRTRTLDAAQRLADRRMYDHKRAMKGERRD